MHSLDRPAWWPMTWTESDSGTVTWARSCTAGAMAPAVQERANHEHTYVAGYTNGYIYYCPTVKQLRNVGGAQEDSDCILDAAWQAIFEAKVEELLGRL